MKRKITMIISFIIMITTGCFIINYYSNNYKTDKEFENLRNIMDKASDTKTENIDNKTNITEKTEMLNKYKDIYNKNKDIIGWISDYNNIDYPIMQNKKDSDFYIHKSFNKEYSFSGCLYVQNHIDINSDIIIINGHNMKNGTMFGTLDNYLDKQYFNKHSTLYYSDLFNEYKLEIQACCRLTTNDFNYGTCDNKEKMLDNLKKYILIGSLDNIDNDNNIVILNTCSYHSKNGRLLVVCKY